MKGKASSLIWSILHGIGDTIEEKVLLKYNENIYFFYINIFCLFLTLLMLFFNNFSLTLISFLVLIIYSIAVVLGDYCYGIAIKCLPISLVNLIESGSLFIILICDIILGYIEPKPIFILIFIIFFISIYIFSLETNKQKEEIKGKKINLKGIRTIIISVIFYSSEPYFLKLAYSKGASIISANIIFFSIGSLIFYVVCKRKKIENIKRSEKKHFFTNILILSVIYSICRLIYCYAFSVESPTIINVIMKLQLFVVVILSIIRHTDKMNLKKFISLLVAVTCIIIMSII